MKSKGWIAALISIFVIASTSYADGNAPFTDDMNDNSSISTYNTPNANDDNTSMNTPPDNLNTDTGSPDTVMGDDDY